MRTALAFVVALAVACNGDNNNDGIVDPTPPTNPTPGDACADDPGGSFCDGDLLVLCNDQGAVGDITDCAETGGSCDQAALACTGCQPGLDVPGADAAVVASSGIFLDVDARSGPFDERRLRMRAITVTGAGTLSLSGPFEAFADDGTPLTAGDDVDEGTILVRATAAGTGELGLTCDEAVSIPLTAGTSRGLAGRALSGHPWFEDWRLFTARDVVEASIDPAVHFDRVGQPYDAWVVPHRSPTEWAANTDLGSDAVAGPVPGTVSTAAIADGLLEVWSPTADAPGLYEDYDLVLDFGQDGTLDPGDLIDGFDEVGLSLSGDLSAPGPYTPMTPIDFSINFWNTFMVYAPQEVDQLDPMPVVAISHGNGHDYTWYDYLGNHLASHGYVVMSHRNDTVPGPVTAAVTTWENTESFLSALPQIGGGVLDGEVDSSRITWIGHSRGGESVVIAYNWVTTGQVNPTMYDASDIVLVSSIAPTIFEGPNEVNPHGVNYHLLAGSADGDVTGGADCDICQYFRIFQRSTGEGSVTYVQGADHNDFNCCGTNDFAWTSGTGVQIGRDRAQQLAKSYYLAMLEFQLHGHDVLGEYIVRATENFRPPGTDVRIAGQHRRATGDRKFVVDDFQTEPAAEVSSSGGAVTSTVRELFEGPLDDGQARCASFFGNDIECRFAVSPADPMNGMTYADADGNPARGVVFQWDLGDDGLTLDFALPPSEADLTDDAYLSFRAAQSTRHPNTVAVAGMGSFSVALIDGQGNVSAIDHRVYGGLTAPYARTGLGAGSGWANEFHTIRVPLSAFTADGRALDLSDVTTIQFLFGPSWGSEVGRVGLDDIEILQEGIR